MKKSSLKDPKLKDPKLKDSKTVTAQRNAAQQKALEEAAARRAAHVVRQRASESGGQDGPEPTRYGDWEKDGIVSDF